LLNLISKDSFAVHSSGVSAISKLKADRNGGYFSFGYVKDTCTGCPYIGLFVRIDSLGHFTHYQTIGTYEQQFYDGTQVIKRQLCFSRRILPSSLGIMYRYCRAYYLGAIYFRPLLDGISNFVMPVDSNLLLVSSYDQTAPCSSIY
jgi:hypothetical protein